MKFRKKWGVYFYLLPVFTLFAIFVFYPLFETFRLSLYHSYLLNPEEGTYFVGSGNFKLLLNRSFLFIFILTLIWTVSSVFLKLILGFYGAILLKGNFKGRGVFRALILPPWIIPLPIGAFVWNWVYNGQYGILNGILLRLCIIHKPFEIMSHPITAFLGCLVNDVWVGVPLMTLIILAGLQSVPEELYEASAIDGAGSLQQFKYITLPQIRTVILIGILISTIWTFNSFDIIWVHTRGGPLNATTTLVIKTFKTAFENYRFGLASALATVTFIILILLSYLYSRFIKLEG